MRAFGTMILICAVTGCGEATPASASAEAKGSAAATTAPASSGKASAAPAGARSGAPDGSATAAGASAVSSASAEAPAPAATPFQLSFKDLKILLPISDKLTATMAVKPDGTIHVNHDVIGKIVGSEMQDAKGKAFVTVDKDGSIKIQKRETLVLVFNDKDELLLPGGSKVTFEDNLVKTWKADGKLHDPDGLPKVEGVTDANSKRTAMLLAVLFDEDAMKVAQKKEGN